jgi:hypothetical protein
MDSPGELQGDPGGAPLQGDHGPVLEDQDRRDLVAPGQELPVGPVLEAELQVQGPGSREAVAHDPCGGEGIGAFRPVPFHELGRRVGPDEEQGPGGESGQR